MLCKACSRLHSFTIKHFILHISTVFTSNSCLFASGDSLCLKNLRESSRETKAQCIRVFTLMQMLYDHANGIQNIKGNS